MTKIEGITPPKKHKTISQRRGVFRFHADINRESRMAEPKVIAIAAISLFVLLVAWIVLLSKGALTPTTQNSDTSFVKSLGTEFDNNFNINKLPVPATNADASAPSLYKQ